MSRALMVCEDAALAHEVRVALRSHHIDEIDEARDWKTLSMLVRLASDLVDVSQTLVIVPTGLLLRNGIESLLQADDLFRNVGPHIVPIILVAMEHLGDLDSLKRMTGFTQFITPPLIALEIGRQLGTTMGSSGRRAEPAAPSGSLFATSARMLQSQPDAPVRRSSGQRITTELPSLRGGETRQDRVTRGIYALYMHGRSGVLRLGGGRQSIEVLVRDGQLGRRVRTVSPTREQVRTYLARRNIEYTFEPSVVPSVDFERFDSALVILFEAIEAMSVNDIALELKSLTHRYPTYTDLVSQRQAELSGQDGFLGFCQLCKGELTWEQLVRKLGANAQKALRWAFYAMETDLVLFVDGPSEPPLTVRYTGLDAESDVAQSESIRQSVLVSPGSSSHASQRALQEEIIEKLEQKLRKLRASDPHDAYGLRPGCGPDAVKERFYAIVKENHPDVYGGNVEGRLKRLAEDVFIEYRQILQRLQKIERGNSMSGRRGSDPSTPASDRGSTIPPGRAEADPPRRRSEPFVARTPAGGIPRQDTPAPEGGGASAARRTHRAPSQTSTPRRVSAEYSRSDNKDATSSPPWRTEERSGLFRVPGRPPSRPNGPPSSPGSLDSSSPGEKPKPPWAGAPAKVAGKTDRDGKKEDAFKEGDRLLRVGQYERARESFAQAVEDDASPRNRSHLIWASFLSKTMSADDAELALAEVVRTAPERVDAYVFLGRLSKLQGQDERAARFFKKALAIDPKNVDAVREVRLHNMRKDTTEDKNQKSFFGRLFSKDK